MLNWLLWIFVYFVFVYITAGYLGFLNVWYQTYKFFNPYGIKYSWNIKYLVNKWKIFFMTREHFVESDYRLRKKYPRERFVGRVAQNQPVIVLQDLALIRKLTVNNFNNFVDRKVYDKDYETLAPRCLYFLRDKDWQDMRSTISPVFTTFRITQMIPYIEYVAKDLVDVILHRIQNSQNSSDDFLEIDVRKVASFVVNDVIAKCVYGMRVNTIRDVKNEFYEMGNIIASDRNNYIPHHCSNIHPDTPNIDEAQEYFYRLTLNAMRKRESYILEKNDILQLFVKAKKSTLKHDGRSDDNKEFGFASVPELNFGENRGQRMWSNLDFAAQAMSFHGDGYNTVVTALSFALHELALQPQIQERLAREIMLQHEENNGSVTFQSIKNMKYMDMVVSETLRLWPPITYLERLCVKDSPIGKPNPRAPREYTIKKGTSVWIPIWAIHRDPHLFPNPEKFDPERFSNQNIANINPMAYMPFGSGPRNCIGSKFALCELKIFLYYIILYTKVYPSKKTCIPSKLCPESLDVRLKGGHTLNIKARSLFRDLSL